VRDEATVIRKAHSRQIIECGYPLSAYKNSQAFLAHPCIGRPLFMVN
jgi:hypothetical protein